MHYDLFNQSSLKKKKTPSRCFYIQEINQSAINKPRLKRLCTHCLWVPLLGGAEGAPELLLSLFVCRILWYWLIQQSILQINQSSV